MAYRTIEQWQAIIRDNLENIRDWRSQGFTIKQICTKLGTTDNIYYILLHQMPEFKAAHDIADIKLLQEFIEPTIVKRAKNGFKYIETTEQVLTDSVGIPVRDEDGKYQYYVAKKVHKTVHSNALLVMLAQKLDRKRWGSNVGDVEESNNPLLSDDLKDLVD